MKSREAEPIDNQMYDALSHTWWEQEGMLALLRTSANPWRVPYFSRVLQDHFGDILPGCRLLDVSCGGGLLAEEFDRLGCRVTGIDLSHRSVVAASLHARDSAARIHYLAGSAVRLPFPDHSFEIAACADVLEHIHDWPAAVAEISRVLRPGGVFLFDTINRTWKSRLTLIFGAQRFPLTRIFPPGTHVWGMFITPQELVLALQNNRLSLAGLSGSRLAGSPLAAAVALIKRKLGLIGYPVFGERIALRSGPDLSVNYIGYAVKEAQRDQT